MNPAKLIIALVALFFVMAQVQADAMCVGCSGIVGVLEQYAMRKNYDIPTAAKEFCGLLANKDGLITTICELLIGKFAAAIQVDYANGVNPDVTCSSTLNYCTSGCTLWKTWPPVRMAEYKLPKFGRIQQLKFEQDAKLGRLISMADPNLHKLVGYTFSRFAQMIGANNDDDEILKENFVDLLDKVNYNAQLFGEGMNASDVDMLKSFVKMSKLGAEKRLAPSSDNDKDMFSTVGVLRGSDWRGQDCDDNDANVYPGRKPNYNSKTDSNCNGIPDDVEKELCDVPQYGIMGIGDSATAHFSLPPDWLNPMAIDNSTYVNFLPVIMNEADHPYCSLTTGFDGSRCPSLSKGLNMTSLYTKIRANNRCMHRDYQNLGLNGARSVSMAPPGIINSVQRDVKNDQPVIALLALIGNDVCNKDDSVDGMTTVAEFKESTINSLRYLDATLPAGSHVLAGSLADGRLLYQAMHQKTHALGVPFDDFYMALKCNNCSPCAGWMNTNADVRDATTAHARKLSNTIPEIIQEVKFKNIDVNYVDYMDALNNIAADYAKNRGEISDLIELTDGFHPSTTAHTLIAEYIWDFIQHNTTISIPVNPNNAKIEQLYGNQGGY